MTDEERALEVMRGLAPMRVCYTDAGAAAEVINRIAAALATERERCAAWHDGEADRLDRFADNNRLSIDARIEALKHRDYAAAIRALGDGG